MWTSAKAPSLAELETMAQDIFARLPENFRTLCEGLVIHIEDFPDAETEQEMGLESPFDLLGLYRGVNLGHKTVGQVSSDLDRIFLYRRPLLDYWCESGEDLTHLVRHVLIHEIGHHFGLSDEDMERIEATADADADRRPS